MIFLSACKTLEQEQVLEHKLKNMIVDSIEMEDLPISMLLKNINEQNPSVNIKDIKMIFVPKNLAVQKLLILCHNKSLYDILKLSAIQAGFCFRIENNQIVMSLPNEEFEQNPNQITFTSNNKWKVRNHTFDKLNNDFFQYLKTNQLNKNIVLKSEIKLMTSGIDEILKNFKDNHIELSEFWVPLAFEPGEFNVLKNNNKNSHKPKKSLGTCQ